MKFSSKVRRYINVTSNCDLPPKNWMVLVLGTHFCTVSASTKTSLRRQPVTSETGEPVSHLETTKYDQSPPERAVENDHPLRKCFMSPAYLTFQQPFQSSCCKFRLHTSTTSIAALSNVLTEFWLRGSFLFGQKCSGDRNIFIC